MDRVTYDEAAQQAQNLRVNTDVISIERLQAGMNVELEHGSIDGRTDVTGGTNDRETIAKIALAHFKENPGSNSYPDYYVHLRNMELNAERYWAGCRASGGVPPSVILPPPEPPGRVSLRDVLRDRNPAPRLF